MNRRITMLVGIAAAVLLVDLILINYYTFFRAADAPSDNLQQLQPLSTPSCSSGCLYRIQEATASVQQVLEQRIEAGSREPAPTTAAQITTPSKSQEFFIPLGSGSTTKNEWTTISGLEAQINSANYHNIKSVSFEASLRNPTGSGRLEARLTNLTNNAILAETEVFVEGSQGQRVQRMFVLHPGNNLYGVQLRSTLGALGILDIARIKIVTN